MRLIATLLPLLCSTLVASESLSLFGDQAPIGGDDLKVPGKNPLSFCADPSDYILSIDYVDLDPNPPTAGSTLSIIANGTLSEDIDEGAKVLVQVKYGLIRLINQEADLCEQIGNVDLECPLKEGEMALTKDVKIPKEVPKGKYTVMAEAYTKDKKKITCLEAVVYF